jgi:type II secretory pathway pseudopilin PulG
MLPAILKPMKRGGYRADAAAFTIVEVMIVLAVSGLILLSAISLVNGRQNRTEFSTGINDLQQQIQQIINETASGYYPNGQDFTCSAATSGTLTPVTLANGSGAQGTNAGCIFLGKVVQFGLGNTNAGPSQLGVLPLVGNQFQYVGGTPDPIAQLNQAVPRAAHQATGASGAPLSGESNVPTATAATDLMEYGLHIATSNSQCSGSANGDPVCYVCSGSGGASPACTAGTYAKTGIAAFVAGDSSGNIATPEAGSSTNLQSGTEQLSLYGVSGSSQGDALGVASANVGNLTASEAGNSNGWGNLVSASEVLVCVASNGTNQSGLFTISGDGSLSVRLQIYDNSTVC